MKPLSSLYLAGSLALFQSACEAELPSYTSEERVEQELYMVEEIWDGEGRVIVGKIDPLPDGGIACRTPIRKDGSFTAAVAEERELTFYAHGYEKVTVSSSQRLRKSVYDAGMIGFEKASLENLRQWTAIPAAPGFKGEITATLMIVNKDYLYQDHGYSGGSRPYLKVGSKQCKAGEPVTFDGLSRIPYQVVFSGPGLIQQEIAIDPEQGGELKAESITLQQATLLEFTFRTRTRKAGEDWKEDGKYRKQRVVCDGKAELLLTTERDGLGNSMELRLKPEDGKITASYVYYGDDNFVPLGENAIHERLHWEDISNRKGVPRVEVESGHGYLLQIEDFNDTDLETLFQVDVVHE